MCITQKDELIRNCFFFFNN